MLEKLQNSHLSCLYYTLKKAVVVAVVAAVVAVLDVVLVSSQIPALSPVDLVLFCEFQVHVPSANCLTQGLRYSYR